MYITIPNLSSLHFLPHVSCLCPHNKFQVSRKSCTYTDVPTYIGRHDIYPLYKVYMCIGEEKEKKENLIPNYMRCPLSKRRERAQKLRFSFPF